MKMKNLDPVYLNLSNIMQVNIGDGEDTSFWEDHWNDKGILKDQFPRLYALEEEKEAKVKDRIAMDMEEWKRRRDIRGGREREEATSLTLSLDKDILSNQKDRWTVPGTTDGVYSTKWLRNCLETHRTLGQVQSDL